MDKPKVTCFSGYMEHPRRGHIRTKSATVC